MPSKKPVPELRVEAVKSAEPSESVPEKSVHCDVLYDPGPCSRKMDVIFIHGLKVRSVGLELLDKCILYMKLKGSMHSQKTHRQKQFDSGCYMSNYFFNQSI